MTPSRASRPTVEIRLRAAVRQWVGTPHRMGGTQRNGIDCSGFVQRIFGDLFSIKLPRSTALQVHTGKAVTLQHLRPGDLVFFHPPHKVRHVGIYLGSGEFAHASTSKGVTISRLSTAYWRHAYWTARRIPTISG
jgi:lipoprotein Spr